MTCIALCWQWRHLGYYQINCRCYYSCRRSLSVSHADPDYNFTAPPLPLRRWYEISLAFAVTARNSHLSEVIDLHSVYYHVSVDSWDAERAWVYLSRGWQHWQAQGHSAVSLKWLAGCRRIQSVARTKWPTRLALRAISRFRCSAFSTFWTKIRDVSWPWPCLTFSSYVISQQQHISITSKDWSCLQNDQFKPDRPMDTRREHEPR